MKRADFEARARFYASLINSGALIPEEVDEAMSVDAPPEADKRGTKPPEDT